MCDGWAPRALRTSLVAASERSMRRPISRNNHPWPRHALHLHPAERRQIRDHAVQVHEHVIQLDASMPEMEVLLKLIENAPRVVRKPIAHGGRDPAHLAEIRAQHDRIRIDREEQRQLMLERRQTHRLPHCGGIIPISTRTCRSHEPRVPSDMSSRVGSSETPQQSRRLLRLDVAAEPEQIVRNTAQELGVEAFPPDAEPRRRQHDTAVTGPSDTTHVSLLPPRCIVTIGISLAARRG